MSSNNVGITTLNSVSRTFGFFHLIICSESMGNVFVTIFPFVNMEINKLSLTITIDYMA